MWQAEVRVDLDAIRHNVTRLRAAAPTAELMAVVKADGYGHGMVPVARAAVEAGATALGVCTLEEALTLRRAGITAPVLAWLLAPGLPLHEGVSAGVDLSAASVHQLHEIVAAGRRAGRPARLHLKLDTGLGRGGAAVAEWPALAEAAGKAQADGEVEVVGVWSHLAYADAPGHPTIDRQSEAFHAGLAVAEGFGITPRYRHLANSAATLTRPDTHFDLVRPGIALYGLSPVPGETFGLRAAMTARARVTHTKRVPAGHGVSYGHTYHTARETTLGAEGGVERGPGVAGGAGAHHRRAGLHGPDRAGLRGRPGRRGGRGGAVRARRGRCADRRRLGRGGRHDQLRDSHQVRGAPRHEGVRAWMRA